MVGRQYTANNRYRFGFNGKENDNEVKGAGNFQDYGFRVLDPRIGRFLSVDPLTPYYPSLTPYQFASNRVIDGIDLEGLEYKSAADWMQKFIANYTIGWDDTGKDPHQFKTLRKKTWREVVGNYMYCANTTSLAYAQGNSKIADYLQTRGFETNRLSGQFEFFRRQSKGTHYLIKPESFSKADRGDILFIQDPNQISVPNGGHVAILATNTRTKQNGFTVNVYSTNAGVSSDPAKETNLFGEAIYYFVKQGDGNYLLTTKWVKNIDTNKWEARDMRTKNLKLQGFGRVEEARIVPPTESNTNNNKDNTNQSSQ